MIELKDAIKIAEEFFTEVYKEENGLLLESATFNENENTWYISFSLPRKFAPVNQLQVALGLDSRVIYKTVKINQHGKVLSMEMGVPNYHPETKESESKQIETV